MDLASIKLTKPNSLEKSENNRALLCFVFQAALMRWAGYTSLDVHWRKTAQEILCPLRSHVHKGPDQGEDRVSRLRSSSCTQSPPHLCGFSCFPVIGNTSGFPIIFWRHLWHQSPWNVSEQDQWAFTKRVRSSFPISKLCTDWRPAMYGHVCLHSCSRLYCAMTRVLFKSEALGLRSFSKFELSLLCRTINKVKPLCTGSEAVNSWCARQDGPSGGPDLCWLRRLPHFGHIWFKECEEFASWARLCIPLSHQAPCHWSMFLKNKFPQQDLGQKQHTLERNSLKRKQILPENAPSYAGIQNLAQSLRKRHLHLLPQLVTKS